MKAEGFCRMPFFRNAIQSKALNVSILAKLKLGRFFRKEKGFFFTAEALLSLLLFTLVFFSFSFQPSQDSLKELYLLQKSDDLLKVWGIERNFSREEMLSDIAFVFPNNCVVLGFDGKQLNSCEKTSRFFSTSAGFFDDSLNSFEIKLTVYY